MKKSKIIIPCVLLLVLCILIPLIIHLSAPFVPSELSADGVLAYVIEAVSAVATFTLALVAVWQTKKANNLTEQANAMTNQANDISKRMLKIEENRNKMEIRPFVMMTGWRGVVIEDKARVFFYPDKMYIEVDNCDKDELAGLEFTVQNVTNGYLSVIFDGAKSKTCDWNVSYSSQSKMSVSILPGEVGTIVFVADPDFFKAQESDTIHFEFILENKFSNRYKEEFDVIITSFTDDCVYKEGEYYCHLFVQNFSIGKFEKINGVWVLIPEEL